MGAAVTHYRTCHLCEAMCGLAIEMEDGRIASVRGDAEDVLSHGHICPKGVAIQDLHADPDRLTRPMRRTASGWQEVSWDDALDAAAQGLHRVQEQHGRDAVASYLGNPTVHDYGAALFATFFLRSLRSKSKYSATSVDQLPHHVAAWLMFGHGLLLPIPDLDRTRYFLALGANPIASGGSLMTAPGAEKRLAEIRKRGGKVVVVDPRRTETARVADEHVFIRPGTDALFLLALLHELLEAGPDLGRLADFTDGVETLRETVRVFPPVRVAQATGVPADVVRRIARDFRDSGAAVCYGRVGTSTQEFGGLCQWLVNAVNVVTGNLDREGGALFTSPAFDIVHGPRALTFHLSNLGKRKSRVRGLPDFGGELPVAALAEEIETPGPGQVRALFTLAGNPVLSTPNGVRLDRALASLEFMVSVDPHLNETTRHAHVLLPPAPSLSRGHYDLVFNVLAVRNTAKYSAPILDAPPGSLPDWRIALELMRRVDSLRHGRTLRGSVRYRLAKKLGPEGILDLGLRLGPYGRRFNPFAKGLDLARLKKHPHGLDLGPLRPSMPKSLATKTKRIDLAPAPLVADVARLTRKYLEEGPANGDGRLALIGRRNVRDNNSWMHNTPRLMRGATRCTLLIHPEDAKERGLADGALAEVSSRTGSVRVPVAVTEDVMRGVVCLPHGYGHGRDGTRLSVAAQHAGASLNDLTDEEALDALTGVAAFSGVPVRVSPAAS